MGHRARLDAAKLAGRWIAIRVIARITVRLTIRLTAGRMTALGRMHFIAKKIAWEANRNTTSVCPTLR